MLNFKSFISEDVKLNKIIEEIDYLLEQNSESKIPAPGTESQQERGKVDNNTKGVLHEHLVGYHLLGGKHMTLHPNEHKESPEQAHDRLAATLHPDDYNKIYERARKAAEHIRSHLPAGHEIVAVHHTSKPGDTEKVTGQKATQKEDSSDIYISTRHPKTGKITHHGISLKVSDRSSKNVPASSLGMESSGSKARELANKHKKDILTAHPELQSLTNSDKRKEWLKHPKNVKAAADIKQRNLSLLRQVAHSHAAELQHKLDSGDHESVVSHIRDVLSAKKTPAQRAGHNFIKHTSYETAKGTQFHASNPGEDFEHIFKNPKNIRIASSGTQTHFYHTDPETGIERKFATQAHKFDSQSDPLSTLKSAGKAV